MLKISIIVPIYNAEDELKKSIDSIINQTIQDLEIILVDDGSRDNSLLICREYEKKDKRIKVIHQENRGVSVARNKGIDIARGEYIGFVDADDWIESNMYERLLNEAKTTGSDIVMCDATTVYSNGKKQEDTITQLLGSQILEKSDFTPSLLLEMAGSAWRCIYKNYRYNDKLTKSEGLHFPLGVKFSEDRIFNIYAFGYARKISYIKESYYNRYKNEKSVVHRFHEDYFEAYKKAADGIENAIRCAWNNDMGLQKAYLCQLIGGAIGAICNYYYKTSTLSESERRIKIKRLCEDMKLRSAILNTGQDGIPEKWIINRNINLLIIYAKLANLKHRR